MNHVAPSCGRGASRSSALARSVAAIGLVCVLASLRPASSRSGGEPPAGERSTPRIAYEVAPNGEWLVAWSREHGDGIGRAWLVTLDDGSTRSLDHLALSDGAPGWDGQNHLRVQIVDRELGVPEMQWIDVETQSVVASTRDRARMRDELDGSAASWANIERKKLIAGRVAHRVTARGGGRQFELSGGDDVDCQISTEVGVVFYSTRNGPVVELFRHDIANDDTRRFAQLDASLVGWSIAPSGDGALLVESCHERRARVIDTASGMLLHGPWMADDAAWVEGAGGRYIALTRGPRKIVYDTLRDREIEVASGGGDPPRLFALDDGRFVVESDGRIRLCDGDLRDVRTLFDRSLLAVGR